MAETSNNSTTTILIWVIAIACGLIGFFLAEEVMAIIFALIVGVVVGAIVYWILTRIFTADDDVPAAEAPAAQAAAPVADPAPAAEPVVQEEPEVTEEPVAEAAPAPAPVAEPAPEPEAPAAAEEASDGGESEGGETEPVVLDGPKGGHADDLKKIKGVGPGLEKTLNELGIFHFDQIAAWGPSDIEWVDARLKFKGRITRDDWVSQAKELAK